MVTSACGVTIRQNFLRNLRCFFGINMHSIFLKNIKSILDRFPYQLISHIPLYIRLRQTAKSIHVRAEISVLQAAVLAWQRWWKWSGLPSGTAPWQWTIISWFPLRGKSSTSPKSIIVFSLFKSQISWFSMAFSGRRSPQGLRVTPNSFKSLSVRFRKALDALQTASHGRIHQRRPQRAILAKSFSVGDNRW